MRAPLRDFTHRLAVTAAMIFVPGGISASGLHLHFKPAPPQQESSPGIHAMLGWFSQIHPLPRHVGHIIGWSVSDSVMRSDSSFIRTVSDQEIKSS
jgi:hypothetical protein